MGGMGGGNPCEPPPDAKSLYATSDVLVGDITPTPMCKYKGQVLLILNVAEL